MISKYSYKKVLVIGFLALNTSFSGGQEIKTRAVYYHCLDKFGPDKVDFLDTINWKKHPIQTFLLVRKKIRLCENIVICPASRGIRVFGPLVWFFSNKKKQKTFYAVVGGWLPSLLTKRKNLRMILGKYSQIFVETFFMKKALESLGMCNISILRNTKRIEPVDFELITPLKETIKVCTFSRIRKEKGIEDAISIVEKCNQLSEKKLFSLTIFGQIENVYAESFSNIMKDVPNFVSYGGLIDSLESVEILKHFDVLLFPTHYVTEGFPGTLIDGFASGLIIVASKIPSVLELIKEGENGFLFTAKNIEEGVSALLKVSKNPTVCFEIKKNNRLSFDKFREDSVFEQFDGWLLSKIM